MELSGWHIFRILFFILSYRTEKNYFGAGGEKFLLALVDKLQMLWMSVVSLLGLIFSK